MTDTIIKGSGNSRTLKTVPNIKSMVSTLDDLLDLFIAGFPVDVGPLNPAGCEQIGTGYTKAEVLSDETATIHGKDATSNVDDMWDGLIPVGGIIFVAKGTPPDGFLFCDGSSLLISDYSSLYSVIGTLFGGNGNNFNLPDLRNKFLRGISSGKSPTTNLGSSYGATVVPYATVVNGTIPINPSGGASNGDSYTSTSGIKPSTGWISGFSAGAVAVRPENTGLLPVIKY